MFYFERDPTIVENATMIRDIIAHILSVFGFNGIIVYYTIASNMNKQHVGIRSTIQKQMKKK